jgi:hypothetical protein
MLEWKYLWSEPFQSRCVLAANWLKDCPTIVEIGGYKTPISQFVSQDKIVYALDPRTEESHVGNFHHLNIPFQDWNQKPEGVYGVVILGIELHLEERDWQKVYDLIESAQIVVIEVPLEHCHSVNQFARILENTKKKIACRVTLDLSDNDYELVDSAPPKCIRQMNLLRGCTVNG